MRKHETLTTKVINFDSTIDVYEIEPITFTEDFEEPFKVSNVFLNQTEHFGRELINKNVEISLWQADDLVPVINKIL